MKQLIYILLLFNLSTGSFALTIKDVGEYIKKTIEGYSHNELTIMLKNHLIQMRLMSRDYKWNSKRLENISDKIIDPHINVNRINSFVDHIIKINEQNDYLVGFLNALTTKEFDELEEKIEKEGTIVFPSVVTFALVLDNLTKAIRDDWKILEEIIRIFPNERRKDHLFKYLNLFQKIKLYSVEVSVKRFVKIHKKGKVEKNFGKILLPMNIWEAAIFEQQLGNKDNANVGKILAKYKPNGKISKKLLEIPEARFSNDGKAILLGVPEASKWADLYSVWNLNFISHYHHFPFAMVKLLIPQVANHYGNSEEYMYNRVLALYLHLSYSYSGFIDGESNPANNINWFDESFYKFFGSKNLESAEKYEDLIRSKL